MGLDLSFGNLLGLSAGVLVLVLGGFVLAARPHAPLNRFFFLFTVADGTSTVLFVLRNVVDDPALKVYFNATYWYFFIVFVGLLAGFGLLFPRLPAARTVRRALAGGVTGATGILLALYVLDHDSFWHAHAGADGSLAFPRTALGDIVFVAFVVVTQVIMIRLLLQFRRANSPSARRQAVFVLAGLMLAYAPFATAAFMHALTDPVTRFLSPNLGPRVLAFAYAATLPILAAVAVSLARDRDPARALERRVGLSAVGGVLALTALALLTPTAAAFDLVNTLGLLAYPCLLGYAILRYEVFDIDLKLKRAAVVGVASAAVAAVFVTAEEALESLLAGRVLAFLPEAEATGLFAALLATGVAFPIARLAKGYLRDRLPGLPEDVAHGRKLEIYRHALEGALADGRVDDSENRTLAALRQSLGLSRDEHRRILGEVTTRAGT